MSDRAQMTSSSINDLPDSAFAYIESGGTKDSEGKTVPRSLRHFPIHDAAHVRNALSRAPQSPFGKQAMPKIMAAAKKFGIDASGMNDAEPTGLPERSVPFEMTSGGDGLSFEGYAAVFNSPTRIDSWEGTFDEVILPGAFRSALSRQTPVLMFEHGKHPLIGSMPLGVITRAEEDAKGLHIEARLSDNWLIQPVRDAVRDRAVTGMSFRFSVDAEGEVRTRRSGDVDLRAINEMARVPELGPVVFPAYEPTTATVRSLIATLPDVEQRQTEDPTALCMAACAAMDAAMSAMDGSPPDMATVRALMTAADTSLDALMAAMGMPDPAGGRSTDFTGRPTRGVGGGDPGMPPGGGTPSERIRLQADHDLLRLRGIIR